MKDLIVFGAGAIGRGFLQWVFHPKDNNFIFVDTNKNLIASLKKNKQYKTFRVKDGKLEERVVPVKNAYCLREFSYRRHKQAKAIFVNVGPRNCLDTAKYLKGANCPIILSENDPSVVDDLKNLLNYDKVYFAIPDVITSNTASRDLLSKDPLSVITEDGTMFVDSKAEGLKGDCIFCDNKELNKQWTAKLYLHNTPHCIAAYLGSLIAVEYIHEAMQHHIIREIVAGAMQEMLTSLKLRWDIDHSFLDWYAEKELKRFSNRLLCDPVARVAREPLRKLGLSGRLIGAAQICISLGFIPKNILIGIVSAILFENAKDSDSHLIFVRKNLSQDLLLQYILGLRKGEALEIAMKERLNKIILELEQIVKTRNPKY